MRSFGLLCIDLLLVVLATLLSLFVRNDLSVTWSALQAALPFLSFMLMFASIAIVSLGLHRSIWRLSTPKDYQRVCVAVAAAVLGAVLSAFLTSRLDGVPRSLPLLQFVTTSGLMIGVRFLVRERHQRKPRVAANASTLQGYGGANSATVLVVGLNSIAELYLKGVAELGGGEIEIAGILARADKHVGRFAHSYPVLGTPEDVALVVRDLAIEGLAVDRIVVTVPMRKLSPEARAALLEIEAAGDITLLALADQIGFGSESGAQPVVERAADERGLEFTAAELRLVGSRPYFHCKRALDMCAAVILLVAAAPVMIVVALLVMYDVGAPILFVQRRPGLWGRTFWVYKFRTMSGAYDRDGNRVAEEDRTSVIGRFLRGTRLDETPQLFNVLLGDMSFVGPRPLLPIDQSPEFKARLLVRPGITGWAQVVGGRIIEPADKAALDVWYVQNASLALDLGVLVRTIPMLLRGDRVSGEAIMAAWRDLAPTGICARWGRPAETGTTALADDLGTPGGGRQTRVA